MIPAEIPDPDRSHAESLVFRKIKTETPDDWVAIHSVGLANHSTKPWAEIDFVLITDLGVWCLEVKGGIVEHHGGQWSTNGKPLRESPFQQAGGGSAALYEYLRKRVPKITDSVVGHGVCFPNTSFTVRAPEIDPELLYDDDDLERPFEEYIQRLARRWAQKLRGETGARIPPLGKNERSRVLHEIAPDFQLLPSLRAQITGVTDEMVRLTDQQAEILRGLEDYERVLVRGSAGTGKTMLAIHEAKRLAGEGKRTLLTCFSRRLAGDLRARTQDLPHLEVRHFHGLMAALVRDAGLEATLPKVDPADLFDVFYPEKAIDALASLDRMGLFDALVIDEAQDLLKDPYLQVCDALLAGELADGTWRVFYDPNQDRFEACDQAMLKRLEGYCSSGYHLRTNCRNTKQIATATTLLTALPLHETLRADGPDIHELWYEDATDEAKQLAKVVRSWMSQHVAADQIAILSPRRFEHSCAALAAKNLPARLIDASESEPSDGNAIQFSTVAGFKGLESDCVILTDVSDLDADRALLDVYLGASRARVVLAILMSHDVSATYLERAKDFADRVRAGALTG